MAKLINGKISGRIGDKVFYQRNGETIVRSMPNTSKKRKLKEENALFSKASSFGKAIRAMLLPAIPNPTEKSMQTRLTSILMQWLRTPEPTEALEILKGFEFSNPKSPFSGICKIPIKISQRTAEFMDIDILPFTPTEVVYAPSFTGHFVVTVSAMICDMEERRVEWGYNFARLYAYNTKHYRKDTPVTQMPVKKGSLIICAASVEFIPFPKYAVNEKNAQAAKSAGIVDVIYL